MALDTRHRWTRCRWLVGLSWRWNLAWLATIRWRLREGWTAAYQLLLRPAGSKWLEDASRAKLLHHA